MQIRRLMLVVLCAMGAASALNTLDETMEHFGLGSTRSPGEAMYRIPGSTSEIVLERRGIHLFLAEYQRTLILRSQGEELLRIAAAVDTGGMSRMEIYRISRSAFYLSGAHSSDRYVLDTQGPAVGRHVFSGVPAAAQFVGAFDRDDRGWRFIASCDTDQAADHHDWPN